MSTYSTNLALELIGTGDQAGTWGSTTNTNLGTLIEQAIAGYVQVAVATGTDKTLVMNPGATAEARNMYIELTGSGGASTTLTVPNGKTKLYFIYNNTTSSAGQVTVRSSISDPGVSVPAGARIVLVNSGTAVVPATNYMAALTLGTALPVASGGTGATSITSGALVKGNGTSAFSAASASDIVTAIGSTAVTNATNATNSTNAVNLTTTNFTVQESGGKLIFKYGSTTIASMDSSGNFTTLANVTAYGTP